MTVVDHVDAAAAPWPASVPASPFRLRFVGRIDAYWGLLIRGAIMLAVTLGTYRFWLHTDQRRFLWAAIDVKGDTPEYTGTASELLTGFLIAVGIIVPVYALLFAASLEFGIVDQFSGIAAFVVLAGLGEFAAYRARRYRLSRTVFRGLKFHQTGSAAGYAVRAMLWWLLAVLTLGLAWPWAVASLERYKMRSTFYGNLGGSFAGLGRRLFGRGIVIWLLAVCPAAAALVSTAAVLDGPGWQTLSQAVAAMLEGDGEEALRSILAGNDSVEFTVVALTAGVAGSVLMTGILYPAYQAIAMRWWLGGLRLGKASAASDLPIGRYYGTYLRYLLHVVLFTIPFVIAEVLAPAPPEVSLSNVDDLTTLLSEMGYLRIAATFAGYVIYLLGLYAIYEVTVRMRLWQAAAESMLISGYAAFDHVRASEAESSAVGEGLVDALGGGSN